MKIETTEDGWDCIPELNEAVQYIDNINNEIYEIKNCVRATKLKYLIENMIENLSEAIGALEEIDSNIEIINVDEE
jgi:hypothetical protein